MLVSVNIFNHKHNLLHYCYMFVVCSSKSVVELLLVDPVLPFTCLEGLYAFLRYQENTSLSNVQGDAKPLQEC